MIKVLDQPIERATAPIAFRVTTSQAVEGIGVRYGGLVKGRVERAHHTLQDRLVKELRLAGMSTIEAANGFLPAFMQT